MATALTMIERARALLSSQLALFLLVGGSAAAAQWLARFPLNWVMPYPAAVVVAYGVGMAIAFELNRRYVFPAGADARHRQFVRFFMVNILSFAMVWAVSIGLGSLLLPRFMAPSLAEALGHGVGVLSPALASYFLHKHFTFRAPAPAAVAAPSSRETSE
jgi:putative flippase GtrA